MLLCLSARFLMLRLQCLPVDGRRVDGVGCWLPILQRGRDGGSGLLATACSELAGRRQRRGLARLVLVLHDTPRHGHTPLALCVDAMEHGRSRSVSRPRLRTRLPRLLLFNLSEIRLTLRIHLPRSMSNVPRSG